MSFDTSTMLSSRPSSPDLSPRSTLSQLSSTGSSAVGAISFSTVSLSLSPDVHSRFIHRPSHSASSSLSSDTSIHPTPPDLTVPCGLSAFGSLPSPPASPLAALKGLDVLVPGPSTADDQLDIDNRAMMNELMSLGCSKEACDNASEVICLVVPPPLPSKGIETDPRREVSNVSRWLQHWCYLTPHPLCTLINAILLIERIRVIHPQLSSSTAPDTSLRVAFAAFLLSVKWGTDSNYINRAFVKETPWSLKDINAMEKELLSFLCYDCFISAQEMLKRAAPFWTRRSVESPGWGQDDGEIDLLPGGLLGENLFLWGYGGGFLEGAMAWLAGRVARKGGWR